LESREDNVFASVLWLAPADSNDPRFGAFDRQDRDPAEQSDLPYRVELWNGARSSVELVLAVTANASIGYAAYFAATRDYPDRHITLRFRDSVLSRWNGAAH
jgi:hypothetical protein